MNIIRVETDQKRTRYKGEYAHLASWKRDFIADLKTTNKLAAAIVEGKVKVEKETNTATSALYTCTVGVMTHFLLALTMILKVGKAGCYNAIDKGVYIRRNEKPYYKYIVRIALDKDLSAGDKEQQVYSGKLPPTSDSDGYESHDSEPDVPEDEIKDEAPKDKKSKKTPKAKKPKTRKKSKRTKPR